MMDDYASLRQKYLPFIDTESLKGLSLREAIIELLTSVGIKRDLLLEAIEICESEHRKIGTNFDYKQKFGIAPFFAIDFATFETIKTCERLLRERADG